MAKKNHFQMDFFAISSFAKIEEITSRQVFFVLCIKSGGQLLCVLNWARQGLLGIQLCACRKHVLLNSLTVASLWHHYGRHCQLLSKNYDAHLYSEKLHYVHDLICQLRLIFG